MVKAPPPNEESNAMELEDILKGKEEGMRYVRKQNVHTCETTYGSYSRENGLPGFYANVIFNLNQRNRLYTNFLKGFHLRYGARQENKENAKWDFYNDLMAVFYSVIFVLLLLTAFLIVTGVNSPFGREYIPTIITALVGMITGLIVVPKIIAKYLFDPEEDSDTTKLILKMQARDAESIRAKEEAIERMTQDERDSE